MKRNIVMLLLICCIFCVAGCSTSVKRVGIDEMIDYSGRWNDTDSRLTANSIIEDILHHPWVDDYREAHGRKPVVIVGDIKNRTEEHINVHVFVKDLERALLNAGKVKFVASSDERGGVREERIAQNTEGHTRLDTVTLMGDETGAGFMLIGSINTIKDETKGRYVIFYQVNMELVDMRTNEKVWIGQNSLKKVVRKSKYSL